LLKGESAGVDSSSKQGNRAKRRTQARVRRGYLLIDLIKVTIKTAEINISPPAATRPRETKKMVPALAGGPHSLLAHTKAKSEAKKVRRIRIIPPGRSRIWIAAFSTV
jgi:hypothetical protein